MKHSYIQLVILYPFQAVYKNASLVLTDGKPLIWISKLYKTPIKEKISGSDLFPLVCELARDKKYKMFFLGAAEGVAAKAAENLKKRFPGLNVVGTYSPKYGFEKDKKMLQEIIEMIKNARANEISYLVPFDFDFLVRGGRVKGLAAKLGGLLKLIPILKKGEKGEGFK